MPRARTAAACLTAAVTVIAIAAQPATAAQPTAGAARAKIDGQVLARPKGASDTFFVVLRPGTNLAGLPRAKAARAGTVVQRLQATADASQAALRRLLRARRASFQSFWIANTVKVRGSRALAEELAARPEVERVVPEREHPLPKPAAAAPAANAEWNVERVKAPQVWSSFGDRGQGMVVASIDTGVQYDHPALIGSYRGNKGDGTFDHNYNWFDPARACPASAPCDDNSHGTHTMGTIVGDGGPGNQIGVAPGARWIAAKGCGSDSCADSSLLAAGQWLLAPTDLNGANKRPDLAPDVVNNSWGGAPGDPFFADIVQSWVAAGIFPVFSAGNSGPACHSAGGPGDQVAAYSVGATDSADKVASFSARGSASGSGELKPNLTAPGVAVRSSVPGNGYAAYSGTSMAAPEVTGTVALMWSASPALVRNIDATRKVLDDSAIDTPDSQCEGSADDNNVYGEGRLDALAAVSLAPKAAAGDLTGTVTDTGGQPVAGATVRASGPDVRSTTSGDDGTWRLTVPGGTWTVTASGFGWRPAERTGLVAASGQTASVDLTLEALPRRGVSGVVRDDRGAPVAGATVTLADTPLAPVTSGADGAFSLDGVPDGGWTLRAARDACVSATSASLTVAEGSTSAELVLPRRADGFGHVCDSAPAGLVPDIAQVLPLSGDDASTQVALPFAFPFYGAEATTANVSTNGLVSFPAASGAWANGSIPSAQAPNGAVYALWDDLVVPAGGQVLTGTAGAAPDRQFVIEWRQARFLGGDARFSFQVVLHEGGDVELRYGALPDDDAGHGGSATVGLEDAAGADAFQYAFDQPVLTSGTAIRFRVGG